MGSIQEQPIWAEASAQRLFGLLCRWSVGVIIISDCRSQIVDCTYGVEISGHRFLFVYPFIQDLAGQ
jgi:hypothetical protein